MEESDARARAAYTDIDGTVTAYNTIFEFLRFDAAHSSRRAEAEDFLACLRESALAGVPRAQTNARYFHWWRGRRVADVAGLGELWADDQSRSPADWRFLEPVASVLDAHARQRRRLVAVTASFEPALVRVRRRWPQLDVLCTRPVISNGRYKGGDRGGARRRRQGARRSGPRRGPRRGPDGELRIRRPPLGPAVHEADRRVPPGRPRRGRYSPCGQLRITARFPPVTRPPYAGPTSPRGRRGPGT